MPRLVGFELPHLHQAGFREKRFVRDIKIALQAIEIHLRFVAGGKQGSGLVEMVLLKVGEGTLIGQGDFLDAMILVYQAPHRGFDCFDIGAVEGEIIVEAEVVPSPVSVR